MCFFNKIFLLFLSCNYYIYGEITWGQIGRFVANETGNVIVNSLKDFGESIGNFSLNVVDPGRNSSGFTAEQCYFGTKANNSVVLGSPVHNTNVVGAMVTNQGTINVSARAPLVSCQGLNVGLTGLRTAMWGIWLAKISTSFGPVQINGASGVFILGKGGPINLDSTTVVNIAAVGAIDLVAGGAIVLDSLAAVEIGAAGAIDLSAIGDIAIDSVGAIEVIAGGAVDITGGGAVVIDAVGAIDLTAGAAIAVEAGGAVDITGGGAVVIDAVGAIDLTAGAAIALDAGGVIGVEAAGAVDITAGAAIAIDAIGGIALEAGTGIAIDAGGGVEIGAFVGVGINAGGWIEMAGGLGCNIASPITIEMESPAVNVIGLLTQDFLPVVVVSSRAMKKNINLFNLSDDNILLLNPVEFEYDIDKMVEKYQLSSKDSVLGLHDTVRYGLLAEDLIDTPFEFAINYSSDGKISSLDYNSIFTAMLNHYQNKIKQDRDKFDDLYKKYSDLDEKYNQLNEVLSKFL